MTKAKDGPRCEAFVVDPLPRFVARYKPCMRPAAVERDGHRACWQHGRRDVWVMWSPI